jgi:hypothetical protein
MNNISADCIHGYVISYTHEIFNNVEAPFAPLNNLENPRPDWQEYWPIRNFLLNEQMHKDHYYGFFSPRFKEKTGLNSKKIVEYLTNQKNNIDVFIFSPQPDMGAFFINVFEQNEIFDPGFKEAAQNFCKFAGLDIDISNLIMDSRNIVFSNYFIAKPSFWKRWLEVCEILFNTCEYYPKIANIHGWTKSTTYRDSIQRKVFLIERIASLILNTETQWKMHSHNPFLFAYSGSRLNQFPEEAVICDALKIAFKETGNMLYLRQYSNIIKKI